jgi:hypothetical protein
MFLNNPESQGPRAFAEPLNMGAWHGDGGFTGKVTQIIEFLLPTQHGRSYGITAFEEHGLAMAPDCGAVGFAGSAKRFDGFWQGLPVPLLQEAGEFPHTSAPLDRVECALLIESPDVTAERFVPGF